MQESVTGSGATSGRGSPSRHSGGRSGSRLIDSLLTQGRALTLTRDLATGDVVQVDVGRVTRSESRNSFREVEEEVWDYAYGSFGNLVGVDLPDGTQISYAVDAAGRRTARYVGGVYDKGWRWEGQLNPVVKVDTGTVVQLWAYGPWGELTAELGDADVQSFGFGFGFGFGFRAVGCGHGAGRVLTPGGVYLGRQCAFRFEL